MITIAVVGISGVGKTTLIRKAATQVTCMHLQASALIKDEQRVRHQHASSSEELRLGAVQDNQSLLVAAFHRSTKGYEGIVVFDGHALIDGANGPVAISHSIFGDVGCRHIVVVQDDPAAISQRRKTDRERLRRGIDIGELARHQELSLENAQNIGRKLGIDLTVLNARELDAFVAILKRFASSS